MVKSCLTPMPKFSTIGRDEKLNLLKCLGKPLSGYLGGVIGAGYWIERLSSEWSAAFNVPYAIPCNSATSGLLAACMAAGIGPGDEVWVSSYTMSATAGAPKVLGANVKFIDIEDATYGMQITTDWLLDPLPKAVIITNLFGHPAELKACRQWCDTNDVIMIEDNAQAPFAMEGNKYAGTIGHIGVFSLNVHKHLQAGEGGVCVTSDSGLADRLKGAINHGELAGHDHPGLNLRMTEPIAAIACAQLEKAERVIQTRIDLAHEINHMFRGTPIAVPVEREGCKHVYYMWAGKIPASPYKRRSLVAALNERGVPFREGYIQPLHKLFSAEYQLPVVEQTEADLITFEVCAYDPNAHHLKSMDRIIQEEAEILNDSA